MTQRVNFCQPDVLEIDRCTFEQPDTINRFFYFTPMQFLSSNLHIKKKKNSRTKATPTKLSEV